MKTRVVYLVDAGTGNIRSVGRALTLSGADVCMVKTAEELLPGRVVLPGVGAFGRFVEGLKGRGLTAALKESVERGDPLLGICVGMQAFFDASEEFGDFGGLGLMPGRVVRFREAAGYKVPHTGWNQLWPKYGGGPLLKGLPPGSYAYFNHSYYCQPRAEDIRAETDYGSDFACVVQHQNIQGVQFHPEKSQRVGLKILQNFLEY